MKDMKDMKDTKDTKNKTGKKWQLATNIEQCQNATVTINAIFRIKTTIKSTGEVIIDDMAIISTGFFIEDGYIASVGHGITVQGMNNSMISIERIPPAT